MGSRAATSAAPCAPARPARSSDAELTRTFGEFGRIDDAARYGVMAVGMTFVITGGGIDLDAFSEWLEEEAK